MFASYRNAGFTLVELMVTLAVAAIILTLAVPSFQGLIEKSQLTTEANGLASAMQVARSEAVKRGENVSLTANGASFAAGFCVHSGANCTDTGANPTQIRQFDALASVVSSSVTAITFTNMGELSPGTPVNVIVSPASCSSGKEDGRRRVFVGVGGQVRVTSEDCP